MALFETSHTGCGHYENVHVDFDSPRINFERITFIRTYSFLAAFLHCMVWSLCNQLLIQFSINVSQTLQTYCGHIENVYVEFGLS